MAEKLRIENFGPIKTAEIEMGDLTVFVGPQATGKSLTAQTLYFFRRLEDLVEPVDSEHWRDFEDQTDEVLDSLEWWFGSDISIYSNPDTILDWEHPDFAGGDRHSIRFNQSEVIKCNDAILHRVVTSKKIERAEIYIPSGRALYGFLPSYRLLSRFLDTREWPGYILNFYETLGRTIKWLHENQELVNNSSKTQLLRSRISEVFRGKLEYGVDTVGLKIGKKVISPTTMAGGQMEIWPFWTIVEAGVLSERLKSARIYFDEPEAHLHPSAQRAIVEIIAYLVNQGTQFMLTTHSPYILYAINLLLQAHEVQSLNHALPKSIASETILTPGQVAAYRFSSDGTVHNIKDPTTNLIDEDELDRVADDLGATFTELLESLE